MKKGSITRFKLNPKKPPKSDWRAFDAMSDKERREAALADADDPPATKAQLASARRRLARGGRRVTLESLERDLKRRTEC